MEIAKSCIVRSLAGRDKDRLFVVVGLEEPNYALLVDGRMRKIENPKRKKSKHLRWADDNRTRLGEKILNGEKFTNAEVRRLLSQLESSEDI